MGTHTTIVGGIDSEVLAFTTGKDPVLDLELAEADCLGSAAHVTALAALPLAPPLFSGVQRDAVVAELVKVIRKVRKGSFEITAADQDVHLALERALTSRLGGLGKNIHIGRSRNDQVAVDLRLYAKFNLQDLMDETVVLGSALLALARKHAAVPMVGRTHLQPAMPSSVGLWASSYAEALLDDLVLVRAAYDVNDRCPLGSAAGFGVTLPLDRNLTARLLGFREPIHNVLYASHARGKCEAAILGALCQLMLTLARLSEDLILYSMPEFGYFEIPEALCTGSSIMPQKRNPDVLELIRAKCGKVLGCATAAAVVVKGLPGGYNRDLQEIKEPFLDGIQNTRACLRMLSMMVPQLKVCGAALRAGFTPGVFAADHALRLVAGGRTFRDAYDEVKGNLGSLEGMDPDAALKGKTHLGGTGRLGLGALRARNSAVKKFTSRERRRLNAALGRLLGVSYPSLARS